MAIWAGILFCHPHAIRVSDKGRGVPTSSLGERLSVPGAVASLPTRAAGSAVPTSGRPSEHGG